MVHRWWLQVLSVSILVSTRAEWSVESPSGASLPVGRSVHVAAWEFETGLLWIHGGNDQYALDDLWTFDFQSQTWELKQQASHRPSARSDHVGLWDPGGQALWIHGGFDGSNFFKDVWKYSAGTWSLVADSTVPGPGPRGDHVAVWDGFALWIHGGYDGHLLGDLWRFDASSTRTWTRIIDTNPPSPRAHHVAIWDDTNAAIWVHGGYDGGLNGLSALRPDLLRFDIASSSWTVISNAGPSGRAYHVAAWDPTNRAIWIHGGFDGLARRDLWTFDVDKTAWELIADQQGPSRRFNHAAAWDVKSTSFLIHGGYSDGKLAQDLWRYRVTTTSTTWTSTSITISSTTTSSSKTATTTLTSRTTSTSSATMTTSTSRSSTTKTETTSTLTTTSITKSSVTYTQSTTSSATLSTTTTTSSTVITTSSTSTYTTTTSASLSLTTTRSNTLTTTSSTSTKSTTSSTTLTTTTTRSRTVSTTSSTYTHSTTSTTSQSSTTTRSNTLTTTSSTYTHSTTSTTSQSSTTTRSNTLTTTSSTYTHSTTSTTSQSSTTTRSNTLTTTSRTFTQSTTSSNTLSTTTTSSHTVSATTSTYTHSTTSSTSQSSTTTGSDRRTTTSSTSTMSTISSTSLSTTSTTSQTGTMTSVTTTRSTSTKSTTSTTTQSTTTKSSTVSTSSTMTSSTVTLSTSTSSSVSRTKTSSISSTRTFTTSTSSTMTTTTTTSTQDLAAMAILCWSTAVGVLIILFTALLAWRYCRSCRSAVSISPVPPPLPPPLPPLPPPPPPFIPQPPTLPAELYVLPLNSNVLALVEPSPLARRKMSFCTRLESLPDLYPKKLYSIAPSRHVCIDIPPPPPAPFQPLVPTPLENQTAGPYPNSPSMHCCRELPMHCTERTLRTPASTCPPQRRPLLQRPKPLLDVNPQARIWSGAQTILHHWIGDLPILNLDRSKRRASTPILEISIDMIPHLDRLTVKTGLEVPSEVRPTSRLSCMQITESQRPRPMRLPQTSPSLREPAENPPFVLQPALLPPEALPLHPSRALSDPPPIPLAPPSPPNRMRHRRSRWDSGATSTKRRDQDRMPDLRRRYS